MESSARGIALTKSFESCRLVAYQDGGGVWTLGWGHTEGVKEGDTCDQATADKWLAEELAQAGNDVLDLVDKTVQLNQNQFDALTDFTYNEGRGHLEMSTLLKRVNAGRNEEAANEFLRWKFVHGEVSSGLLRRRMAERELYLAPVVAEVCQA